MLIPVLIFRLRLIKRRERLTLGTIYSFGVFTCATAVLCYVFRTQAHYYSRLEEDEGQEEETSGIQLPAHAPTCWQATGATIATNIHKISAVARVCETHGPQVAINSTDESRLSILSKDQLRTVYNEPSIRTSFAIRDPNTACRDRFTMTPSTSLSTSRLLSSDGALSCFTEEFIPSLYNLWPSS